MIGALLTPAVLLGLPTPWAAADGGDFTIDFVAAGPFTYNHATGVGGEYDGRLISKTNGVTESLEGGDFNCGDKVVYFAAIEVDPTAIGSQDIEIDFVFDSEPTGQGTVGIDDLELAALNAGDTGNSGLEGDEAASIVSESLVVEPGQDHLDATVGISNLDAGEQFILRLVTTLACPDATTPTGNIQARVADARVVSPVADGINVGAQVVPMMSLADIFTGGITIIKDAVPNNAQDFAFTAVGDDVQNFILDDDGTDADPLSSSQPFSGLAPGVRTITETPVAGWTLSNIVCIGATNSTVTIGAAGGFNAGDTSVTIGLADGENVICTFTNTQQGSITIVKDADPNNAQDFAFTTVGTGLQNFGLDDDGDNANTLSNTESFSGLAPGVRTITETPVAGWTLSNIVCTGATNSTVTIGAAGGFNAGDTSVTIDLAPGENVSCRFTNTKVEEPGYGDHDPGDVDPGDPYGQDPVDPNVVDPYVPAPTTTTTTVGNPNAGVAGETNPLNPVSDQPQVLGGQADNPAPGIGGMLPRTGAGILGASLLALLLVGVGMALMQITRRRRSQPSA